MFDTNFTAWDWVIVAVYLTGSVAIGLIARRYIRGMTEFVVAGRKVRLALAIATMTGTEMGLVTVMYSAQEGFARGLSAIHIGIAEFVCILGIGLSGVIIVPLRRMGVMTIPEFYGRRFGFNVRIVGAVILALAGILNMGLFLKAGAIFVTGVAGWAGEDVHITVNLIMTAMLLLVLVYTSLGGMISVVITDFIQFIVLGCGIIFITLFAMLNVGWDNLFNEVLTNMGPEGVDPRVNPRYGYTYIFHMLLIGFCSGAVWQTSVQRACIADSAETARKLYLFSSFSFFVRRTFPVLWGTCAFVFILAIPELHQWINDPDAEGTRTLFALPLFIGNILPPGLLGLAAAGMLAAFMSTHDSYLLCWSSVIVNDIVHPLKPDLTQSQLVWWTRGMIVLIGVFLLACGLWMDIEATLWNYMVITGTIYFAGALPVLVAGLYWKRATWQGALASLLAGLLALGGLLHWQDMYPDWENAENIPTWIALGVFAICALLMWGISILTSEPEPGEK